MCESVPSQKCYCYTVAPGTALKGMKIHIDERTEIWLTCQVWVVAGRCYSLQLNLIKYTIHGSRNHLFFFSFTTIPIRMRIKHASNKNCSKELLSQEIMLLYRNLCLLFLYSLISMWVHIPTPTPPYKHQAACPFWYLQFSFPLYIYVQKHDSLLWPLCRVLWHIC